jgi:hypothetical protein
MYERISALRKARTAVIAAAGVIGVGAALVAPPALAAKPVSETASEPIQYQNSNCGVDTGGAQIGTVTFTRTGNRLKVDFALQGAYPNATYDVQLWDGSFCFEIKDLGNVKTDSSGDGSRTFHTSAAGSTEFFATGVEANTGPNDSLIANLP